MQKKKNIRYLIVFLILLAWTIIFANLEKSTSRLSVKESLFAIEDTASIVQINIKNNSGDIVLIKQQDQWIVNNKYKLDPSMRKVLLAVLHEVRIKQIVPKKNKEAIIDDLEKNGMQVSIEFENGTENEFIAGGNGISVSYITQNLDDIYVVNLPGYESYVSGIFEVNENDWRDRLLYQSSWLGIKTIKVSYTDRNQDDLVIHPDRTLYQLDGVSRLDTVKLMQYVEDHSFFYVDQYIKAGQIPEYDSLAKTKPFAGFFVDALGFDQPLEITFYNVLPGEEVILGVINQNEYALFQKERMNSLFKTKENFEK